MATTLPQRLERLHLQRFLLTGILTLLPIWLTWVVFKFVFVLLAGISQPWIGAIFSPLARTFPGAFGWLAASWLQWGFALVVTVVFIYVVGWATNRVVGQRLIRAIDATITRIPLMKTIYGGAKKLLDLMQTRPEGLQRVVLIDFPHRGMKAVGLVTRVLRDTHTGEELAAVYVPTTPNPTSGYLEIVPVGQLTPTDMTMDQAMAFIISGGAIAPETIRYRGVIPTAEPTDAR